MQVHIQDIEYPTDFNEYSIWGKINIQIDNIYYPDNEWYDAVSSILDMWTAELVEYISTKKDECYLNFMDGPFYIKLTKMKDTDRVTVTCKNQDGAVFDTSICCFELIQEILTASYSFLDICREKLPSFVNTTVFSKITASCIILEDFRSNTGDGSE